MPGLRELSDNDFGIIARNKIFEYFLLQNASLFVNNERFSLIILPNVQYSKRWMDQIAGTGFTDNLFMFAEELIKLKLTMKEYALILPVVLTTFTYGMFVYKLVYLLL